MFNYILITTQKHGGHVIRTGGNRIVSFSINSGKRTNTFL